MLKNVRIPTALTLAVSGGVVAVLAVSMLAGACAYTTANVLDLASTSAQQAHDTPMLARLDEFRHRQQWLLGCLAAMLATGLATAVGTRRWLDRKVVTPLDGAMQAVSTIAQGDLRKTVVIDENTQARKLFSSLAHMQQALVATISLVKQEAGVIDGNASELANQNLRLANGTDKQAVAIQQTSATAEQISEGVQRSAQLAVQTNALAVNTSKLVSESSVRVRSVIEAMDSIIEDSRRISDVVSVVDDLAFQTNILALNAAVEAARAGQEGRGFAVVASEVRSLAQRSANAGREIDALVTNARRSIEQGARLCGEVGSTMNNVVLAAQEVVQLSNDMSLSASEQSLAISQLNEAIREIDGVTQQNARLVQRFVEATGDLNGRANTLANAVAVWQLKQPEGAV
jgi:methyl-accepting chemotaxis protein